MGLGTQFALLLSNWHRIHAVLKPNRGRVICSLVLTLLAPVALFWGIPIAVGFSLPMFFKILFSGEIFFGLSHEYNSMAQVVLLVMYPPLFYLFSSLIISGIRHRILRIAVFGQVWLAAYGAVLMIFGFYSGNL